MHDLRQHGIVALSRDEMHVTTGGECGEFATIFGWTIGFAAHMVVNGAVVVAQGLAAFGSGSSRFDWTSSK